MALNFGGGIFPPQKSLYDEDGRLLNQSYIEGRGKGATLFAWGVFKDNTFTGSFTVYTVPAGKVLYLASAWMQMSSQNLSGMAWCSLVDHLGATTYLSISQLTGAATQESDTVTIVFPSLIKYSANENVVFTKSPAANCWAGVGFQGWLENA